MKTVQPFPYPVNHDAVSQLEYALDCAKKGEFRSIGFCAVNARGYVTTSYTVAHGENPILVLGAADYLKDRLLGVVKKWDL